VRARQTAEIAAQAGLFGPGGADFRIDPALAPGGDPVPLIRAFQRAASAQSPKPGSTQRLVLVGHEPDLGDLAARLLGAPLGSIVLRKAGLALLVLPGSALGVLEDRAAAGAWRLELLLTPRVLLAG
jgi:phosphohistidine phosphatase